MRQQRNRGRILAGALSAFIGLLGCAEQPVNGNAPPTVSLTANPPSLSSSGTVTLTWSSTNAITCVASGGWTGSRPTSGTETTGVLTVSTAFTLTCTGVGGSASQTASIAIGSNPAPTATVTANPPTISSGQSSMLTWSSTNATACTASGSWSGAKATTGGSESTGPLTTNTSYTLTCTGPGGTASQTTTVTVTTPTAVFPLRVEAGKRYLVDAQGRPFLVHGDSPWLLIAGLTKPQIDQYLEDRRQRGFNTVLVELIEHEYSLNGRNILGDLPFTILDDFSQPNEAYFAHAEYAISKASEKGILVLLTPAYLGYAGNASGWYAQMVLNGPIKLRAFGQYVATRFRAFDNILWVHGGDFDPPERILMGAVANGIIDVETKWLHTFHGGRGTSAMGFLGTSESWLSVNNVYTHADDVVAKSFTEYNRATMPFFLIEAYYENENGADAATLRQQAYQAVLSGASGQLMGNNPIWLFASGWPTALNSAGSQGMTHLRAVFEARPWHLLVPDQTGTVLTAGTGTGADRAATARASDGTFVVSYTPNVRDLTIDMTELAGPNVAARWFDPANGTYATITGSPFAASGSRVFRPGGNNSGGAGDWVLVLESTP